MIAFSWLLAAISVVGGKVGPFVDFDTDDADERHTPGSVRFYAPVSDMDVYDTGLVYRNGAVVTNVPFPSVVASMDDDCDYGWCYDISDSFGPGESIDPGEKIRRAIRMGQFDVSWLCVTNEVTSVRYRAYGTGLVHKTISPELSMPRSARFDDQTRSALLASSEAYFERIFWSSKGDPQSSWDEEYYGPQSPGPDYRFNLGMTTNLFFTHTYQPDAWRMAEFPNFTGLRDALKRSFPSRLALHAADGGGYNDLWLERPGYLSERYDQPTYEGCAWWSSSLPPPMERQYYLRGDTHTTEYYDPDAGLLTLLPASDNWIYSPERPLDGSGKMYYWACRSWTFDALNYGGSTSEADRIQKNPCNYLLDQLEEDVFGEPLTPKVVLPRWKTEAGIAMFLTNAFPYAANDSLNRTNSFGRYSRFWSRDSHRLTPTSYAGLNHLLAAMDRTIAIPRFLPFRYTLFVEKNVNSALYGKLEPVSVEWRNGALAVDYGPGRHGLDIDWSSSDQEIITESETSSDTVCRLRVYDFNLGEVEPLLPRDLDLDGVMLKLDLDKFADETGDAFEGDPFIVTRFDRAQGGGVSSRLENLVDGSEKDWLATENCIGFSGVNTDLLAFDCRALRSYRTASTYEYETGGVHSFAYPPSDAGDRVKEAKYALARLRSLGGDNFWKFGREESYTRGSWNGLMQNYASGTFDDLLELAFDRYDGYDPFDIGGFAPIPDEVFVDVNGDVHYDMTGYALDRLDLDYPFAASNLVITGWIDTYEVTNAYIYTTNVYHVTITQRETEDAWWLTMDYWRASKWDYSTDTPVPPIEFDHTTGPYLEQHGDDPFPWVYETNNHVLAYVETQKVEVVTRTRPADDPVRPRSFSVTTNTADYFSDASTTSRYYDQDLYEVRASQTNAPYGTGSTGRQIISKTFLRHGYESETNRASNVPRVETHVKYGTVNLLPVKSEPVTEWQDAYRYYMVSNSAIYTVVRSRDGMIRDPEPVLGLVELGPGDAQVSLREGDDEQIEADADWDYMPSVEFDAKEAFRPIVRVDWNWKSMKLKKDNQ